jgi:hypothetical protein
VLLELHLAATLYMTGLIWFVQLVHYPLLGRVGGEAFRRYHEQHRRRTGWAVGLPMLVELFTAVLILQRAPTGPARLGLALVALIWLSTLLLQIPCHRRLAGGFDAGEHRRLVRTNWIRVVGWSLRSGLVLGWMA